MANDTGRYKVAVVDDGWLPSDLRRRIESLLGKIASKRKLPVGKRRLLEPLRQVQWSKRVHLWFPDDPLTLPQRKMSRQRFADVRAALGQATDHLGEACLNEEDLTTLDQAFNQYEKLTIHFPNEQQKWFDTLWDKEGLTASQLVDMDTFNRIFAREIDSLITAGEQSAAERRLDALLTGIARSPHVRELPRTRHQALLAHALGRGALTYYRMTDQREHACLSNLKLFYHHGGRDPALLSRILCHEHSYRPNMHFATDALGLVTDARVCKDDIDAANILICAAGSWLCQSSTLDARPKGRKLSVDDAVKKAEEIALTKGEPLRAMHFRTVVLDALASTGKLDETLILGQSLRDDLERLGHDIRDLPHTELRILTAEASAFFKQEGLRSSRYRLLGNEKSREARRAMRRLQLKTLPRIAFTLHSEAVANILSSDVGGDLDRTPPQNILA